MNGQIDLRRVLFFIFSSALTFTKIFSLLRIWYILNDAPLFLFPSPSLLKRTLLRYFFYSPCSPGRKAEVDHNYKPTCSSVKKIRVRHKGPTLHIRSFLYISSSSHFYLYQNRRNIFIFSQYSHVKGLKRKMGFAWKLLLFLCLIVSQSENESTPQGLRDSFQFSDAELRDANICHCSCSGSTGKMGNVLYWCLPGLRVRLVKKTMAGLPNEKWGFLFCLWGVFMVVYEHVVIYVCPFTVKSLPPRANTVKGKRPHPWPKAGRQKTETSISWGKMKM